MLRLLRMQHELLILALCLICGAVVPLAVSSSEIHGMELVAGCTAIAGEMCHARMLSPVPDGLIVRGSTGRNGNGALGIGEWISR